MTTRRSAPSTNVDELSSRRSLAACATLLCPLLLVGCGATTVLRTDGWRYSGPIEAADGDSVTLTGPKGPIVIPRQEVVDYDLPGDGWAWVGAAIVAAGLSELRDVSGRSEPQAFSDYAGPGFGIAAGAALGAWGLWRWLGAREAWAGSGGDVAWNQVVWTGDGVLVRF